MFKLIYNSNFNCLFKEKRWRLLLGVSYFIHRQYTFITAEIKIGKWYSYIFILGGDQEEWAHLCSGEGEGGSAARSVSEPRPDEKKWRFRASRLYVTKMAPSPLIFFTGFYLNITLGSAYLSCDMNSKMFYNKPNDRNI